MDYCLKNRFQQWISDLRNYGLSHQYLMHVKHYIFWLSDYDFLQGYTQLPKQSWVIFLNEIPIMNLLRTKSVSQNWDTVILHEFHGPCVISAVIRFCSLFHSICLLPWLYIRVLPLHCAYINACTTPCKCLSQFSILL